jgi:hypothetical protein
MKLAVMISIAVIEALGTQDKPGPGRPVTATVRPFQFPPRLRHGALLPLCSRILALPLHGGQAARRRWKPAR